jgi:predicted nucleic acid-binding protein
MNSLVTIDASVFVSAFTPTEPAHAASKVRMRYFYDSGTPIIVPSLVIPEIAAALARGQGKPDLGIAFAEEVASLPNLTLVSVDESLARLAAQTAAKYKLRGSDAIYAAVALRFGTQLVTLDREQLERLAPALPVSAP